MPRLGTLDGAWYQIRREGILEGKLLNFCGAVSRADRVLVMGWCCRLDGKSHSMTIVVVTDEYDCRDLPYQWRLWMYKHA